ncbi:o-succinylbenzoate synthase, partial [Haemophilus influenzae]
GKRTAFIGCRNQTHFNWFNSTLCRTY